MDVTTDGDKRVVFVCEHGAFRSRIAAAYFNAVAPPGWSAVSAGVTPQQEASTRLGPLLAGTVAQTFVDLDAPRSMTAVSGSRTVAIDTEAGDAEMWRTHGRGPQSDEALRDEIRDRVFDLAREIVAPDEH